MGARPNSVVSGLNNISNQHHQRDIQTSGRPERISGLGTIDEKAGLTSVDHRASMTSPVQSDLLGDRYTEESRLSTDFNADPSGVGAETESTSKILQTDLSYGRANKRSQTERPSELDINSLEGDTRDINSDPGAGVRQEDEIGFLRMAMHTLMQDRRSNGVPILQRPLSGSYLENGGGGSTIPSRRDYYGGNGYHGGGEAGIKKYSDTLVDYRQMSPPGSPTYTETKASILRRRKNVTGVDSVGAGGANLLGTTRRRFSSSLSELRDVGKESTVSLPAGGRKFSRAVVHSNRFSRNSVPYAVLQ